MASDIRVVQIIEMGVVYVDISSYTTLIYNLILQ